MFLVANTVKHANCQGLVSMVDCIMTVRLRCCYCWSFCCYVCYCFCCMYLTMYLYGGAKRPTKTT